MDVQCDRCKTEYEFDDALVSGRGTTVKCTNCGFQFKVHKQGNEAVDDRWAIRTTDHRDLVFHTLKDLQKAILAKQVGKHDTLARGSAAPRALGAIAELSPFFEEQRKRQTSIPPPLPPPPARRPSSPGIDPRTTAPLLTANALATAPATATSTSAPTQLGGIAQAAGRRLTPVGLHATQPRPQSSNPPPPAQAQAGARKSPDTLRPPESGAVPPPNEAEAEAATEVKAPPAVHTAPIVALNGPPSEDVTVPLRNGARAREEHPSGLRPPPQRARATSAPEISSPLPPAAKRPRLPSYDDVPDTQPPARGRLRAEVDSSLPSHRPVRRVGGWVIAAMLFVSVGIGGVIVGQKYMPGKIAPVAGPAPLDPRAQEFLRTGERALDDGDLETAKESFDKASVIAEKDPRVLLGMARLATVRADVPWLKQRLSPTDASDETKRSWTELSAKAKVLADAALAAAPDDTMAVRVKMDALRIAGERDQARAFVTKIIVNAQQPDTAYVLAALDLAEPEPLYKTIIERLRVAAQAEGNSGRARAALVYALARSGDAAAAKSELDRLGLLARPHPLYASLKTFLEKTPAKGDGGVASVASGPVVDVNNLPRQGTGGGGGDTPTGDSKSLLTQANTAMRKGNLDRASTLFSAALDKNPNDSEAQAGLGDVARAQHNNAAARASYQRAVQMNGHYLPALIGLADAEWELGDKASAHKRYKDMVENFPDGALPAHVKSRAGDAPAPAPTSAPAPTTAPSGAPAP